jgi:hypothetical protein
VTLGVSGTTTFGGYIQTRERNAKLIGLRKYETYSELLANTAIVGACVRLFLNLIGGSEWTWNPVDDTPDAKMHAELAEEWLTEDPATSWRRIVRRSAAYVFYGFSIQEWTARLNNDKTAITFKDISPRAQRTINRWLVQDSGEVDGVWQLSPHDGRELFMPRNRLVYLVDDSLNDSPEGLGIFRHMFPGGERLAVLENLETMGFETDLGGIPMGRAPLAELQKAVDEGSITKAESEAQLEVLRTFLKKPVRTATKSLILDSRVYEGQDETQAPSQTHQWGIDVLETSHQGLVPINVAILRTNREIARIMGCEGLLLGEGSGSMALSREKSTQLYLIVDSVLHEVADAYRNDLLGPLWKLNGLDDDMMPNPEPSTPSFETIQEMTAGLRDLATAGATLLPNDPVVRDIYGRWGLPFEEREPDDEDLSLIPGEGEGEEGET